MRKLIAILLAALLTMLPLIASAEVSKATVKSVQEALNAAGFDCGTPDGLAGKKTYAAIEQFRQANGLPAGSEIDRELLAAMGLIFDKEITFQNVPWGTSQEAVRQMLIDSGFADPDVNYGSGSASIVVPEDVDGILNSDFYGCNDIYFEGAHETGVEPLKTIGGYEIDNVVLSYLYGIENGVINPEDTHLVSVQLDFDFENGAECAAAAKDIYQKLEAQYGPFESFRNDGDYSYSPDFAAVMDAFSHVPATERVEQNLVVFYLYGANDTILIMTVESGWSFNLVYAKSDAWKTADELKAIINANIAPMEDAGL